MVSKMVRKKSTAKMAAKKARKLGLNASYYKKKNGYGVSVTRKK